MPKFNVSKLKNLSLRLKLAAAGALIVFVLLVIYFPDFATFLAAITIMVAMLAFFWPEKAVVVFKELLDLWKYHMIKVKRAIEEAKALMHGRTATVEAPETAEPPAAEPAVEPPAAPVVPKS